MPRYLIVAHRTALSPELREAVTTIAAREAPAAFTLLVPATPPSYWRPWDESEAHDRAIEAGREAAAALTGAGIIVSRVLTGAREPLAAIEDELRESPPYDGIILGTLPAGASRWLRLDLPARVRRRTGRPVVHVVAVPRTPVPRPGTARPSPEGRTTGAPATPAAAGGAAAATPVPTPHHLREDDIARVAIPLAVPAEIPEPDRAVLGQVWDGDAPAVFASLREWPELLNAYVAMLHAIWQMPGLAPDVRELVVLRTAQLRGAPALWDEHREIAEALGVSEDRIARVDRWQSSYQGEFDETQRAVLGYVEALCAGPDRARGARALLRDYLSEDEILLVTMLVGFYWMSAGVASIREPSAVPA